MKPQAKYSPRVHTELRISYLSLVWKVWGLKDQSSFARPAIGVNLETRVWHCGTRPYGRHQAPKTVGRSWWLSKGPSRPVARFISSEVREVKWGLVGYQPEHVANCTWSELQRNCRSKASRPWKKDQVRKATPRVQWGQHQFFIFP